MEYDEWRVHKFDYIGLKVDLPNGARTSPSAKGPATLAVSMHYLSPSPGVLDDAIVCVQIYITKMAANALAEKLVNIQQSNLFQESTNDQNRYWFWRYTFDDKTTRFDDKSHYTYYRRDVKIDNTQILHAYAEVLNAGPQYSQAADHAAVERILDSIELVTVTTNR
jgi:hypothetical protein